MRYLRILAVLGICLGSASYAHAQRVVVGVGIGAPGYIGPAPVCEYGYYGYYPYACAPYGYYGPSWFSGGVFIGAGPWGRGFYGRPGYRPFVGCGFYGRPGYRPFVGRGRGFAVRPGVVARGGFGARGAVRGPVGGFRGGAGFHGSGFHGGHGHR